MQFVGVSTVAFITMLHYIFSSSPLKSVVSEKRGTVTYLHIHSAQGVQLLAPRKSSIIIFLMSAEVLFAVSECTIQPHILLNSLIFSLLL